jgi:DNA-binding transcriptional ArsR family regulator
LRALAHPLRLRMMGLFSEQPRTTKQVAELLGQPPTRLYHHVAALERAGLLILKETRQNRGAVEKWYAGVAREYQASGRASKGKSSRAARRALAATVFDQAKQELLGVGPGQEPSLLGRMVIPIPPNRVHAVRQRLYKRIRALVAELAPATDGSSRDTDCERWALTFALTPVSTSRSRRHKARGS